MDQTTVLCIFVLLHQSCAYVLSDVERRDILNKLTNKTTYDRNYPASFEELGSTNVRVQVNISDVLYVHEQDMEYSTMMLLRMQWDDKRLAFHNLANFTRLELIGDMVDLIWIPDVFISNERQIIPHSFVKHEELVYIDPYGTVSFRMRVSMANYCKMQLMNYPFDEQNCTMKLKSYTFTSDKLLLQWSEQSVYTSDIDLTNFDVNIGHHSEGFDTDDKQSFAGGEFSYLILQISFKRKSRAYGSMYFAPFPIFFLIGLSSFGFGEDIKVRITLCTVGISTTILQWITIYSRLPNVWYFTYLDGWILFHICMILIIIIFHAVDSLFAKQEEFMNRLNCFRWCGEKLKKCMGCCVPRPVMLMLGRNKKEAIRFSVFLILYGVISVFLLILWSKASRWYYFFIFLAVALPFVLFYIVLIGHSIVRCICCCCSLIHESQTLCM